MPFNTHSENGSVPIFVAVMTVTIITSAAVILSGIVATQLRTTEDIISSERAYYAATSGLEEALYTMIANNETGEPEGEQVLQSVNIEDGEVPYTNGETATYTVEGQLIFAEGPNGDSAVPCVSSEGEYTGSKRRIRLGQVVVDCGV